MKKLFLSMLIVASSLAAVEIKSETLAEQIYATREGHDIDQTLSQANYLIHLAKARQRSPEDRSTDTLLHRAVSVIQDYLSRNPSNMRRSELFLLLGIAYGKLEASQFWTLSESSFEACMRNAIDPKILRHCRMLYEQNAGPADVTGR